MKLIDGDAVKERLKNDIKGMEERKEKEKGMLERMEILSQLSFARYAYTAIIAEQAVPAIPLDRIKEAKDAVENINPIYSTIGNRIPVLKNCDDIKTEVLAILDKLIAEVEEEK